MKHIVHISHQTFVKLNVHKAKLQELGITFESERQRESRNFEHFVEDVKVVIDIINLAKSAYPIISEWFTDDELISLNLNSLSK